MREVKFRGKTGEGKWEYGGVVINPRGQWFITTFIGGSDVDSKTVGQYTGLKDKNDKEIYEGDIVMGKDYLQSVGVIVFGKHKTMDMSNSYECGNLGFYVEFKNNTRLLRKDMYFWHGLGMEVTGNVYENPELLEVSHDN